MESSKVPEQQLEKQEEEEKTPIGDPYAGLSEEEKSSRMKESLTNLINQWEPRV
jgi:glycylpeptide N-tetradecanoyltransferase